MSRREIQSEADDAVRARRVAVRSMARASQAGWAFLGAFAGFTALGWGLDELAGSSPWGLIGGVSLGFVASSVVGWREIRRGQRDSAARRAMTPRSSPASFSPSSASLASREGPKQ